MFDDDLQITGPVLRALADENEFVRETAYKAGQRLVMMYADSAITLLLPGMLLTALITGFFEHFCCRNFSLILILSLKFKSHENENGPCLQLVLLKPGTVAGAC